MLITDRDPQYGRFEPADRRASSIWLLDPNAATMEMTKDKGVITFRVNFVTKTGPVTEPTTLQYEPMEDVDGRSEP